MLQAAIATADFSKSQGTVGLRTALNILDRWQASSEQSCRILRISRSTYARALQKDPAWSVSLDTDQLQRISLVLNIHSALRVVFDNPENVYGFVAMDIAWHGALVALEQGDSQGALDLYQRFVAPAASTAGPLNRVSDNASFLWRLGLYGHEVPAELWQATAASAEGLFQQPGLAFADVHMALIAAATGDRLAVEARMAGLESRPRDGALPAGPVVPLLCRALLAFAEEDYPGCARLLEPLRGDVARIGGSGAQREVIEDTLLVALMRAGEHAKALALLDERLHRRPSRRDEQWRTALESRRRDR